MKTKVIAFDVYGTLLYHADPENCLPPRRGFLDFARECIGKGIVLVTSSDNERPLTKIDLKESGVPEEVFVEHFQMERDKPKNFKPILDSFGLRPDELLVFGDRSDLDIDPALSQGCRAVLVPVYKLCCLFDFREQSKYL